MSDDANAAEQPDLPILPPPAAVRYRAILAELRRLIVGQEAARRTLALAPLRAAAVELAPRIVLLGPAGSGRGHMVRSLAAAMGGWVARAQLADISETNWAGRSVGQSLSAVAMRPHAAVVHLAGIDDLVVRTGRYTGAAGSTADYREGKQASIRAVLEGREIATKSDGTVVVDTAPLIIVATGHLPTLPPHPSAADYADAGLSDIAEALAAATLIRTSPLTREQVGLVLLGAVCDLCEEMDWSGYDIRVDPSVIDRVTEAVASGRGTLREGLSWIRSGIEAGVAGLLEDGAPSGVQWVLALDDLRIPPPPRGRWVD
jgi:hypothetical protein